MFDITSPQSFQKAIECMEELIKNADPNIVIGLVGNKLDLNDQRKISKEEAMKFAENNGLLYFECSAKTGENVRSVFIEIMEKIPIFEKANFSMVSEEVDFSEKNKTKRQKCGSAKCSYF